MSKQLGSVKTGAITVKDSLKHNIVTFCLLLTIVAIVFIAHDTILARAIVPGITMLETVPIIGVAITWLKGTTGEWDWSKISVILIAVVGGYVFRLLQVRRGQVPVAEEQQSIPEDKASAKVEEAAVPATVAAVSEAPAKSIEVLEAELAELKKKAAA